MVLPLWWPEGYLELGFLLCALAFSHKAGVRLQCLLEADNVSSEARRSASQWRCLPPVAECAALALAPDSSFLQTRSLKSSSSNASRNEVPAPCERTGSGSQLQASGINPGCRRHVRAAPANRKLRPSVLLSLSLNSYLPFK